MICLVDNENKSTSSQIIVYAFKKILLMVSKIALIVHTREIFVLFFSIVVVRLEGGNGKAENLQYFF